MQSQNGGGLYEDFNYFFVHKYQINYHNSNIIVGINNYRYLYLSIFIWILLSIYFTNIIFDASYNLTLKN